MILTQKELKKQFKYNKNTGIFTRRITTAHNAKSGEIIGTKSGHGYYYVSIKKKRYLLHRLAFLYVLGYIPDVIDHIDRDKLNNKWSNLRSATQSENCSNSGKKKNNTSGYVGVSLNKNAKKYKWVSNIVKNRVPHFLGSFKTKEEAAIAYDNAAIKYFGEFANLNFPERFKK